MRHLVILLVSTMAATAQAQGWEFGARYWYSQATTQRSHNAQGAVPALGNPTSVLTYGELDAHSVELHARKDFGERWFVRGNAGLGWIQRGSFDDEDFFAGQMKFSDSTSTVKGNRLGYLTADLGREFWARRNWSIALFAGYHQWSERLDAYGARFKTGGDGDIAESVPVITNEVTWRSLRLGIAAVARLSARTRITLDAALVPYARVRDEDSHYLRTAASDLGPAPNILIEGRGRGLQVDAELRHLFRDRWELGAGLRYWWLRATNGSRVAVGTSLPLNEIESQRGGLTLSLTRRW
jgi:hypothetical protein